MKHATTLLIALILTITACQPAEDSTDSAAVVATSTEADVEANERFTEDWDAAVNAGNLVAVLSLYTDNSIRMHPNEPALMGREAIRAAFQTSFDQNNAEVDNSTVDVLVSGDLAAVRGTFTYTVTHKAGGEPVHDTGKWVAVRQRQPDGSWKELYSIWNSDLPAVRNE